MSVSVSVSVSVSIHRRSTQSFHCLSVNCILQFIHSYCRAWNRLIDAQQLEIRGGGVLVFWVSSFEGGTWGCHKRFPFLCFIAFLCDNFSGLTTLPPPLCVSMSRPMKNPFFQIFFQTRENSSTLKLNSCLFDKKKLNEKKEY